MTSDVVLSAALRNNLLSLQGTQKGIDATQFRLSTGKKVNSALDNPQSFFAAQALTNRASDLTKLLDGIGQSIQVIKAADNGVTALTSLINQAQSIATSAQDSLATGSTNATVTGSVSLAANSKLTLLPGITAGDNITFTVTDPAGGTSPISAQVVTIGANTTATDLVTAINDLNTNLTTPAINASLDATGKLVLTAVNGGSLNAKFIANTAGNVANLATATALGFGSIAKTNQNGAAAANSTIDFTATATPTLVSKALYNGTGIALASGTLTGLASSAGGTNLTTLAAADTLTITVNGKTSNDLLHYSGATGATTTIQGLVDAVNNDTNIKGLISLSYDSVTGKFTIQSTDVNSTDVQIKFSTAAATSKINLGFGTNGFFPGASGAATEDIRFGAAAGALASYQTQFNNVRSQIDALVANGDTGYRGTNLLNGNNLITTFNESRTSTLITSGVKFDSTSLGLKAASFGSAAGVTSALTQVSTALTSVRSFGSSLANDLATIQTRQDFTNNLINTLKSGSDLLTNADQNEEGAKLLALQTRQSLGVTALSLASQSQQSILRLFG